VLQYYETWQLFNCPNSMTTVQLSAQHDNPGALDIESTGTTIL